jgi:hypothetical protein
MMVNFYQTTRRNIPEDSHLYGLTVFENKVLRRIFGSEEEEGTRGRRKLHKEELHYNP